MSNKVIAKPKKHQAPLTAENISEYADRRLLDLHIVSHSDTHVLAFDATGLLRAVAINELETLFKTDQRYPRGLARSTSVKTTHVPTPYAWDDLQTCRQRAKQGRVTLVAYSPSSEFQMWDVSEVVKEFLSKIDLAEVFGAVK